MWWLKAALPAAEFKDWEYWLDSEERSKQPSQERWQTAAVAYQVFQLAVLVSKFFGGPDIPKKVTIADFLVTISPPAKPKPPKTVEEATAAAYAMFGQLVEAANAGAAASGKPSP